MYGQYWKKYKEEKAASSPRRFAVFKTKQDVDSHVYDILSRVKDQRERNSKGFTIGNLYFKVDAFDQAEKYVCAFLSQKENYAPAHKLLGKIYEAQRHLEKAVTSFRRSLELDASQSDVLIKVCELYCQMDIDPGIAQFWAEELQKIHPSHEVGVRLREKIYEKGGEQNDDELLELLSNVLVKDPRDVNMRVKLLKLFIHSEQYAKAYAHALDCEKTAAYPDSLHWYQSLVEIFEVYKDESGLTIDTDFHLNFLHALNCQLACTLQSKGPADCSDVLFKLDQYLMSVVEVKSDSAAWPVLLQEMIAQYFYLAGTLCFHKAQKRQLNWQTATSHAAGCYLVSYGIDLPDIERAWFQTTPEDSKTMYMHWYKSAALRLNQVRHLLRQLCLGDSESWMSKIKGIYSTKQGRSRLYQCLFPAPNMKNYSNRSFITSCSQLTDYKPQYPTLEQLTKYDNTAHLTRKDSLQHLVWIALQYYNSKMNVQPDYEFQIFTDMQQSSFASTDDLDSCGAQTLSRSDTDAFLQAVVRCSALRIAERERVVKPSSDKPRLLPVLLSEPVCTSQQTEWWKTVYRFYTNTQFDNVAKMRLFIQHGLEAIRIHGDLHGVDAPLIVHLARNFQNRAEKLIETMDSSNAELPETVATLQTVAKHYWKKALEQLTKIQKGRRIHHPKERWFVTDEQLTEPEVELHIQHGRLFLAMDAMHAGKFEQAIKAFADIALPEAAFHQAQLYERLAEIELNSGALSDSRRQVCLALLTKARDSLYLTLDRIRSQKNHEYHQIIGPALDSIDAKIVALDQNEDIDDDSFVNLTLHQPSLLGLPSTPGRGLKNGHVIGSSTPFMPRNGPERGDGRRTMNSILESSAQLLVEGTPTSGRRNGAIGTPTSRRNGTLDSSVLDDNLPAPSHSYHVQPSPQRLDAQLNFLARRQDVLDKRVEASVVGMDDLGRKVTSCVASVDELKRSLGANQTTQTTQMDRVERLLGDLTAQFHHLKGQVEVMKGQVDVTHQLLTYSPAAALSHPGYYADYFARQQAPHAAAQALIQSPYRYTPSPHQMAQQYGALHQAANSMKLEDLQQQQQRHYAAVGGVGTESVGGVDDYEDAEFGDFVDDNDLVQEWPYGNVSGLEGKSTVTYAPHGAPVQPAPSHRAIPGPGFFTNPNQAAQRQGLFGAAPPAGGSLTMGTSAAASSAPATSAPPPNATVVNSDRLTSANSSQQQQQQMDKTAVSNQNLSSFVASKMGTPVYAAQQPSVNVPIQQSTKVSSSAPNVQTPKFGTAFGAGVAPAPFSSPAAAPSAGTNSTSAPVFGNVAPSFGTSTTASAAAFGSTIAAPTFGTSSVTAQSSFAGSPATPVVFGSANTTAQTTTPQTLFGGQKSASSTLQAFATAATAAKTDQNSTPSRDDTKHTIGGFSFSGAPVVKADTPAERPKIEVVKKVPDSTEKTAKPFSGFSFGMGKSNETAPVFGNVASPPGGGGTASPCKPSLQHTKEYIGFQEVKSAASPGLNKSGTSDSGDHPDQYEPNVDFKPVIPLPDLVAVETGEENETKLFGERAKLFRYDPETKQWKERGVGELKILRHNDDDASRRLVMRREQVLKVCANHAITADMKLLPFAAKKTCFCWMASDFTDEVAQMEKFAVRFQNEDIADRFKVVFEEAVAAKKTAAEKPSAPPPPPSSKAVPAPSGGSLAELFKAREGEWDCDGCYVRNKADVNKCVACLSMKPGAVEEKPKSAPSVGGFAFGSGGFIFDGGAASTPSSDTATETVKNQSPAGFQIGGANVFASSKSNLPPATGFQFGGAKSGDSAAKDTPKGSTLPPATGFAFGGADKENALPPAASGGFKFVPMADPAVNVGAAPVAVPPDSTTADAVDGASGANSGSIADRFKAKPGEWDCGMCYVRNKPNTTSCVACTSAKPAGGAVSSTTKSDAGGSGFKFGAGAAASSYKFGDKTVSTPDSTATEKKGFSFGASSPFGVGAGGAASGGFTFGDAAATNNSFQFSMSKKQDGVSTPAKTTNQPLDLTSKSPSAAGADGEYYVNSEADDSHIHFEPVVRLERVEQTSGEENETVEFIARAKLYRYVAREWKERGVGDVKILRHRDAPHRARVLMRRDHIFKVCLNHNLAREMQLTPMGTQTPCRAWVWGAIDHSEDGSGPAELKPETFCIRFRTEELADEFKKTFDANKAPSEAVAPPVVEKDSNKADGFAVKSTPDVSKAPSGVAKDSSGADGFLFKSTTDVSKSPVPAGFSFKSPSSQQTAAPQTQSPKFSFGGRFSSPTSTTDSTRPSGTSPLLRDASRPVAKTGSGEGDEDVVFIGEVKASAEQVERARKFQLPDNFYLFETNAVTCPGCAGCDDRLADIALRADSSSNSDAPSASTGVPATTQLTKNNQVQKPPEKPSSVFGGGAGFTFGGGAGLTFGDIAASAAAAAGSTTTTTARETNNKDEPSEKPGPVFGGGSGFSFAEIASKSPNSGFGFGSSAGSKGSFQWSGAGQTLFGASSNADSSKGGAGGDSADGDEIVQSNDIHFEPIIPLPDLVETTTGEENEECLYKQRVKMYRYDADNKQWKERGIGEMKVLKHNTEERYRMVMRREQIFKLCCNQMITKDLALQPMPSSESAWCWYAIDYSDNDDRTCQQFALRFKKVEQAKEFKEIIDECIEKCAVITDNTSACKLTIEDKVNEKKDEDYGAGEEEEEGDEEEEGGDEDYDEDEDYEDEMEILFEKRATLYYKEDSKFKAVGMGNLHIVSDDDVFGYRIQMSNDEGLVICNHVITIETNMTSNEKKCTCEWSAMDFSQDEPVRREFRIKFSSLNAVNEFMQIYTEGKTMADESGISELHVPSAEIDVPEVIGIGDLDDDEAQALAAQGRLGAAGQGRPGAGGATVVRSCDPRLTAALTDALREEGPGSPHGPSAYQFTGEAPR
ncbi:E3 SUMO-protein ligase RanBP2-like [Tubulanus polymorphus]|uniref:E3 SUMO-protein ligase RanBP2-like n=1 Tax=Tubulanus polymorphus TaxID=672921 RepID=UPI003DA44743